MKNIQPMLCYCLLALFMMRLPGLAQEFDLSKRKLPPLALQAAIDLAQDYIRENNINIEGKFLAGVRYHETGPWTQPHPTLETSGPYWQVTYEPDVWAVGGQVFILVYGNGKCRYVGGM